MARGTSNGNVNGNSEDRRRRREWLVEAYRVLLTVDTVTVDRIIPGCKGGTYRRNNIRPACAKCNSTTGGGLRG
jgi:hypothetical protein